MKVLFISNIPSPYRVDFFNELGKYVELTVIFEAKRAKGIRFDWNDDYSNFTSVFLNEGEIQEKKFDFSILGNIRKERYDMIFATNYSYRTELLAYFKMIVCRINFALEIDGGIIKKENKLLYFLKRFLLTKPMAYFSPSISSDEFLEYYGAKKEKIYRYEFSSLWEKDILLKPVDKKEKDSLKKQLGLNDKPLILYVGQIIYRKGIDILLKSLNNVKEEYQCVLIGEMPDENYLNEISQMINDNTQIISFVDKDTLKTYYQAAEFMVLPTRYDVWGLVVNESLANGTPVITTKNCVAGNELIKDGVNGYLIETESEMELTKTIEKMLQTESYTCEKGKNVLASIKAHTIEQMVKRHMEFLEDFRN